VLAVTVGAVIVALGFAVYNFAGASGGASSPEAAVDQLFTAIDNEDVIGVVTALSPGEREVLKPGVEDLTAELQRLGVLSDFDLGAVPASTSSSTATSSRPRAWPTGSAASR
jgi:hypothetical protein